MNVRTPTDIGLLIRRARKSRGMTQSQLGHAAAVGRQWIVAVEGGKERAEVGKVLQTLAALDLTLSMRGEGIPATEQPRDPIDVTANRTVIEAHRGTER